MPKPKVDTLTVRDVKPTGVVELEALMKGEPIPAPAPAAPNPPPAPPTKQEPAEPPTGPADIKEFVPTAPVMDDGEPPPGAPQPPTPAPPRKDKLREETEKLAREKRELEEQLAQMRTDHETGTTAFKRASEELANLRKEHENLVARSSMGNPMAHPAIQALTKPWNERIPGVVVELQEAGLKAMDVDRWLGARVEQYVKAGEPGTEEFAGTMRALRDEVDNYTAGIERDDDRTTARQRLMGMIRDGASIGKRVQAQLGEIINNAPLYRHKEQEAYYEMEARTYDEFERGAFSPSEELRQSDPLNVSCILRAMIDGSEEVRGAAETAKKLSRIGILPPKPLPSDEVTRLTPEQVEQAAAKSANIHNNVRKHIIGTMAEAYLCRAVLPALWKELLEARGQLEGKRDVPRPRLNGDRQQHEEDSPLPITQFEPVPVDMSKIPL